MLNKIQKRLEELDRTPAWLCRQAGVHRSSYTLVKNGHRKLGKNLENKFIKVLGLDEKPYKKRTKGEK